MDISPELKIIPWSAQRVVLPNLLFVCNVNRLRSPTAEVVARTCGLVADSVGLDKLAVVQLQEHHLRWADKVICMEFEQEYKVRCLADDFGVPVDVQTWHIPDDFEFMDPALCALVHEKLAPFIEERNAKLRQLVPF